MKFSNKDILRKQELLYSHSARIRNRVWFTALKIVLCFALIVAIIGTSFLYGSLRGILKSAPDISGVDVAPTGFATNLYDIDGNVIETLVMAGSNREEVSISDMPKDLINAFVAIEDERFWEHNGIDIKGIFRAAYIGLSTGRFSQGASTITQQLIKNNIFNNGMETNEVSRFVRKIQEQYLAVKLEQELNSKNIILQNYLNTINLGSNTLGVQAASKKYFCKDVSELTLSECAVLAAITQSPSANNPISHPETNAKRQKLVLDNMLEQGYIDQEEYDAALADDVYSRIQNNRTTEGNSPYTYFTDAVIESVLEDLQTKLGYTQTQAYNMLYSGGLSIMTTQDSDIQSVVDREINDPDNYPITEYSINYSLQIEQEDGTKSNYNESSIQSWHRNTLSKPAFKLIFSSIEEAQEAVDAFREGIVKSTDTILSESLEFILQPQASMVVMSPTTGYVLAVCGGRGEKTANRVLNRATDSTRQPGSCFKVLTTFAPALDISGATLATTYYDSPYEADGQNFANWWSDLNLGYCNIRQGIAFSMNIIATKCINQTVTIDTGFQYAQNFGISTLVDSAVINGVPKSDKVTSLSLGGLTYGVTNLEMTAAYAAIANGGVYTEPVFYKQILDHNGEVLLDNTPVTRTVLKKSTAELLTLAMEDTINGSTSWGEYGIGVTGAVCKVDGMSLAGKSGSTTNSNDVWFEGYSPYYVCGIWSGYDEDKSLNSLNNNYHKEIWQKVMEQIHEGKADIGFSDSNLDAAYICSKSGLLAIDGVCDQADDHTVTYVEYFAPGTAPTAYCNRHEVVNVCKKSGLLAGEYCPEEDVEQKIYLAIDEEDQNESDTLDTAYTLPDYIDGHYCDVHVPEPSTEEPYEPSTEDETKPGGNFWENWWEFLFGHH